MAPRKLLFIHTQTTLREFQFDFVSRRDKFKRQNIIYCSGLCFLSINALRNVSMSNSCALGGYASALNELLMNKLRQEIKMLNFEKLIPSQSVMFVSKMNIIN